MSWRNTPPKRGNYETEEEYNDALDCFYDALETDWEERRLRRFEEQ